MTTDTPLVGNEKETLHALFLRKQRAVMLWKLEGLNDEELRRPMVPSGTNLLGMVKHLAAVEYGWFCPTFGVETEPLPFDENDPDADLRVNPDESTRDILDFYSRAQTAVDAVIDDHDLDDTGIPWTGPASDRGDRPPRRTRRHPARTDRRHHRVSTDDPGLKEARVVVEQNRCAKTFVRQDPTRVNSPCDFYDDTAGL